MLTGRLPGELSSTERRPASRIEKEIKNMITSVWARTSAILLAALLAGAAAQAQNVVTDWNTIASTTIVANGGKGPAPSFVWLAYSSIAVYDAVNAIDGQFQPFYYKGSAAPRASQGPAPTPPPHRILLISFPPPTTPPHTPSS